MRLASRPKTSLSLNSDTRLEIIRLRSYSHQNDKYQVNTTSISYGRGIIANSLSFYPYSCWKCVYQDSKSNHRIHVRILITIFMTIEHLRLQPTPSYSTPTNMLFIICNIHDLKHCMFIPANSSSTLRNMYCDTQSWLCYQY